MAIRSLTFRISTRGFGDTHDITPEVRDAVTKFALGNGIAMVFVPGSTAGVTTIEFEAGAIADLRRTIEQLVPQDAHYEHDARWGDGNGFAHVRAALLGPSITVPFDNGELALGTWQQIVLIDFDNRPRHRDVRVQLIGE